MGRYLLDTGVVIGYTFLHDLWYTEAKRIFDTDNSLYIDHAVLFEYCNATGGDDVDEVDVDWESEDGRFGDIIDHVDGVKTVLDMKMWSYNDDEVDVETLVEDFIDVADIEADIEEEQIKEYIRPTLREFIEDELNGREMTVSIAREILDRLDDTIRQGAREKKSKICDRVTLYRVSKDDRMPYQNRVEHFIHDPIDPIIIGDLGYMKDHDILERLITSDLNHLYGNKDRIETKVRATVMYIKDAVSTFRLPETTIPED